MALNDFLPEADPNSPEAVAANIRADGLDPEYQGTVVPSSPPYAIYGLLALALYFVLGDD